MRRVLAGAIATVAALAATGSARADVFVPADPTPHPASCIAAAGDVTAVGHRPRGPSWLVEASEAGGPWGALERDPEEDRCPLVAAAPDGTAAVTLSNGVVVRRAGAGFGAPAPLGRRVRPLAVAAAPGGWVGVVGERSAPREYSYELVATVVAPDGAARSEVVGSGSVLSPRIGIDARGAATVVWTSLSSRTGRLALRQTRTADGRTWEPARTLARSPWGSISDSPDRGHADVAVSAGGRTLVAWADGRGVDVWTDGGPAERVAAERGAAGAGSATASVADDGSAIVAYAGPGGRDPRERSRPGWRMVGPASARRTGTCGPRRRPGVHRALERARARRARGRRLGAPGPPAASRSARRRARPGGAWQPATGLSAITRDADGFSLSLGSTGDPQLLWRETVRDSTAARLRGARLVPDAGPSDTTAPVMTTRLPARTPRTRTGRVRLTIPVSCVEACDARVRLVARRGIEVRSVVRELPPGGAMTARLAIPRWFANELLISRRARRPRLEVLVTDRAGNVASRSRAVVIRVVDRPLLSFQVPLDHEFEMFTRSGNRAVARLVNRLIAGLADGTIDSYKELRRIYVRGVHAIERRGRDEFDTPVLDEIFSVLEVPLARLGYSAESLVSSF